MGLRLRMSAGTGALNGTSTVGGTLAPGGVPPVDFDLIAGYNPLQPRMRERVSRTKPSAASEADAAGAAQ